METVICHITVMSGKAMTVCGGGAEGSPGTNAGSVIFQDARTLEDAMREAIRTSPGSFLNTVIDVAAKEEDYWIDEIRSSTWVVAERGGNAVGVAACKYPDPGKDKEDRTEGRYIVSVWIAPELRGNRLGERLIRFLIEAEYQKNRFVRQFFLWVFPTNSSAIKLYQRLGFVPIEQKHDGARAEVKYRLDVNPGTQAAIFQTAGEVALLSDKEKYGVTYRVLGEENSV